MTRRLIAAIVRLMARVFFRRIEIAGIERIPHTAPVIFAVNHPNALIDPVFLLCFAPRRVSFLAKAPLFRMPLIGWMVRIFDSIPVYRRQDNVSTAGNRETFAQARRVLERGGAMAIFPEGTSHSDPGLREMKTGAARIALGASIRVSIVPTGLYYTAKQTFRSSALMYFGSPLVVDPEAVEVNGEPRQESVEKLTAEIESALAAVTLHADSHAALELIRRAEQIFSAGEPDDLARELELRRQFVAGYTYLRDRDPARLTRLESHIARVDAESLTTARSVNLKTILMAPLGIAGAAIHWPIYRLIGFIATHFASEDELVATIKAVAGVVLYPLFWIAAGIVAGIGLGVRYGVAALVALPLFGYIGLLTAEAFDEIVGSLRAMRRDDVRAQQQKIRDEILSVARELNATVTSTSALSSSRGGSSGS